MDKIPRSISGTINKKELVEQAFPSESNESTEAPDQLSGFT